MMTYIIFSILHITMAEYCWKVLACVLGLLIVTTHSAADPDEATIVAHLEKIVPTDNQRFASDSLVTQSVDAANSFSKYTLTNDELSLYERDSNDKNKDIVIIPSSEDQIPFKTKKRMFVVLKKNPNANQTALYWINVAMLRPALDNDLKTNQIELGGVKHVVEWDRYDDHFRSLRTPITFYAMQCASGFLVPCSFNLSALSDDEKGHTAPKFMAKLADAANLEAAEHAVPVVEDGSDGLQNGELFFDLEFKQLEGNGAGRSMMGAISKGRAFSRAKGRAFGPPPPGYPYPPPGYPQPAYPPPGYPGYSGYVPPPGSGGYGAYGSASYVEAGTNPTAGAAFAAAPATYQRDANGRPLIADVQHYGGQPPDSGIGVLGATLGGVGGVVCGIVSIIASCADEREEVKWPGAAAHEGYQKAAWTMHALGKKRRKRFALPNYFTSVQKNSIRSKREANKTNPEIALDYPGWKTQYKDPVTKGITSESGLFYGFGHCPYKTVDLSSLKANDKSEVIKFYLTALRGNCHAWMVEYLEKLVAEKYLIVKDKGLEANSELSLYKEQKLNLKETLLVSASAEIDGFSNAFLEESSSPTTSPKNPDGTKELSKSVHLIVKAGLKTLERSMEYAPSHILLIRRHLLQSFKQVLTKLRQDAQNLERCKDDCAHDKEINFNDRLQVMGMIQFIRYASSTLKKSSDVKSYYDKFYTKNFKLIESFVKVYQ